MPLKTEREYKDILRERYRSDLEVRERKKAIAKRWYHKNKDKAVKAKREKRDAMSPEEKLREKKAHKEWREKNKDTLAAKHKEYYTSESGRFRRKLYEASDKYLISTLYRAAKTRAKNKCLEFSIELSDVIVPLECPILGISLSRSSKKVSNGSPSLDRIDSSKGYIKGNVQVISFLANTMKSNATAEELLRFSKWVEKTFERCEKDIA